jgi:uncharacterized SAM-binding protein YcdF (DUF218 family)
MSRSERGGILFKLVVLLSLLAFCGLIYLIRRPILRVAGGFWVVEDPLDRADALIILSDDNFYADRATRAVELYRQGLAPVVVASGRRLRPHAGIAELMEHDLVERGVPKQAVIKFPHMGDNTREEAVALRSLVEERRWRRVLVVTSNSHTRRARYIFSRVFPAAVAVRVASARDSDYDPDHWWETRKGQKRFFHETVGMLVAWWELPSGRAQAAGPQAVVGVLGGLPLHIVSQARKHATFATAYSALHRLSPVLSSRC